MMNLMERAAKFAEAAHEGQMRKYTGDPYVTHPARVVILLSEVGLSNQYALAAAMLHDVVEDTDVTISEIRDTFGPEVALMVDELTDVSTPADGNRAARKALDRRHTAAASPLSKMIKLADLIDNADSILRYDPSFAKVFLKEKALLLTEALTPHDGEYTYKPVHEKLHAIASEIVAIATGRLYI